MNYGMGRVVLSFLPDIAMGGQVSRLATRSDDSP